MPYDQDWQDEYEEDEEELAEDVYATKDAVIICIDASSSMQAVRPAAELDQDEDEEEGDEPRPRTFFAGALDCALQWEKRKAFLLPNDLVGILIYNTSKAMDDNPDSQDRGGIYALHPLAQVGIEKCKDLRDLVQKAISDPKHFRTEFPPLDQSSRHWVTPASLFSAANEEMRHANLKTGTRRIFLITDEDDPCRLSTSERESEASQRTTPKKKSALSRYHGGDDEISDVARTRDRVKDFRQLGAEIEPFFLGSSFNPKKFWESALLQTLSTSSDGMAGGLTQFRDLNTSMTMRSAGRRALWTLPMTIAEGVLIGVKGYALIMEAKKPSTRPFNTEGETSIEVHRKTQYFDAKTNTSVDVSGPGKAIRYLFQHGSTEIPPELEGVVSMPNPEFMDVDEHQGGMEASGSGVKGEEKGPNKFDLAWGLPLKAKDTGKGKKVAQLPQVTYTRQDLREIGACGLEPGIKVLGCQHKSCVSFERNVKSPYFLRPTEQTYTLGSTRAFVAFMRCMLDKDLVAIALCTFRKDSGPEICALMPQEETFDPPGDINGAQVKPAGMHVIRFPFLDDLREPPQAVSAAGGITPDKQHVDIMRAIIKKLKASRGYDPADIPNPTLARYYAEIEARAFGEEVDLEQIEDKTLPLAEQMQKRAGHLIKQFKDSINQDERAYMPVPKASSSKHVVGDKRAADGTSDGPKVKKQKEAPDEDEPDTADLRQAAQGGTLAKFTVKQLKTFARHRMSSFNPSNKLKVDMVEAVAAYFANGERG